MTSCLLVKSKRRLVAVADGRLSRDDASQSFNEISKLRKFDVAYKIPQFDRGMFCGYKKYDSEPWYLAYAGTHTVTTEIINLFMQQMNSLYLTRHEKGRHATLAHSMPTGGTFSDDYNFDSDEYLKIHSRDILQELVEAFDTVGSEHSLNRRALPDSQFLLFGNEEATGEYKAFIVSANASGYSPGARVRAKADPVLDGHLASIGSQTVRNEVQTDAALMAGLDGWQVDEDPYVNVNRMLAENFEEAPASPLPPPSTAWETRKVGERLLHFLCITADPSVGGRMILAEGTWERTITLQTVDPPSK